MNKYVIGNVEGEDIVTSDNPTLYIVKFGRYNFIHKSKDFRKGLKSLLDDVFRGIRGKSSSEYNKNLIAYLLRYPAIYNANVDVVACGTPSAILKKEAQLLKVAKDDPMNLNNHDLPQFKPEWMLKEVYHKRCDKCVRNGIIDGKKETFRFCPNCGHVNK